jgi:hypothetical protein
MQLMVALSQHKSHSIVKLLYIGDSGTGKTGSLVSLVKAGYQLRILDMDAGLDSLVQFIKHECPEKIDAVDTEFRRDKYRSGANGVGPVLAGQPKAFVGALELLTKWSDGSDPATWGPGTVFVLDSLTAFSRAAFEWAKGMNPGAKDPRQWYFQAQQGVENVIAMLTSEAFGCNVIIISHVQLKELADGTTKGYANSIGSALGPILPKYFSWMILAQSVGMGKSVKRTIATFPTGIIDLKTPMPFSMEAQLPLESGLATIFEKAKG